MHTVDVYDIIMHSGMINYLISNGITDVFDSFTETRINKSAIYTLPLGAYGLEVGGEYLLNKKSDRSMDIQNTNYYEMLNFFYANRDPGEIIHIADAYGILSHGYNEKEHFLDRFTDYQLRDDDEMETYKIIFSTGCELLYGGKKSLPVELESSISARIFLDALIGAR